MAEYAPLRSWREVRAGMDLNEENVARHRARLLANQQAPSALAGFLYDRLNARERQLEFVRDFIPENHQGEYLDLDHEMRELDIKRRIISLHYPNDPCDAHDASLRSVPCNTLRLLALPFAEHPNYREEWQVW